VLAIMDNCPLTDVDTFINAGTLVIDSVFGASNTDDLTKEIERWFVAHMVASTVYRTTSNEKIGDAAVTYTGRWGMNLDSTPYGQMVKVLDVTGEMANIGKMAASIYAVKSFE
jgi:uncharacterized protein (DUF1697 family)